MEQRLYYGAIAPVDLARYLVDIWDRDDTIAQVLGAEDRFIVQIGQRRGGWSSDEPHQALTLDLEATTDGLRVTMGQQQWYDGGGQLFVGGMVGFFPFFFTFPLGRLFDRDSDDIDQTLPGRVWRSIEEYVGSHGAVTGATQRLPTVACPACGVANPQGAETCSACGEYLGGAPQCSQCGHINPFDANYCNRCGNQLRAVGHTSDYF